MKKTIDCKPLFGAYWKKGLNQEFVFEVPPLENKAFADTVWKVYSRSIYFVSAVRLIADGNKNEALKNWLNTFAKSYEGYVIPFGCATFKANPDKILKNIIRGDYLATYPDSSFIRNLLFEGGANIGGYAAQTAIKKAIEQIKWVNKPRLKTTLKTNYLPKICVAPPPPAETLEEIYKGGEITPGNSFTIKGLNKAGKLFFLYACICLRQDIQLKQYVNTDRVLDVSEYRLEAITGVNRENIKNLNTAVKGMVAKNLLFRCNTQNGMGWFATPVIIIDPNLDLRKTGGKITRVKISKDFVANPQVRQMLTQYFNIEVLTGLTLPTILKSAIDLDVILSLFPVLESWHKKELTPMSYATYIKLNNYPDTTDTKKKLRRAAEKLNHKLSFERGGDWVWKREEQGDK